MALFRHWRFPAMSSRRLACLSVTALLLPTLASVAAAAPSTSWVVSVSPGFASSALPAGADVTARMDRVHVVVVAAPARALPALVRAPGVRGVYPDAPMHTTSTTTPSGPAVFAPAAAGGAAGTSGAGS